MQTHHPLRKAALEINMASHHPLVLRHSKNYITASLITPLRTSLELINWGVMLQEGLQYKDRPE